LFDIYIYIYIETASGSFPLVSVETMHKIALEAESVFSYMPYFNEIRSLTPRPTETTETVASSAVNASLEEMAGAIVVLSTSGTTPRLLAKYRPRCPIIVVTRKPMTARRCHVCCSLSLSFTLSILFYFFPFFSCPLMRLRFLFALMKESKNIINHISSLIYYDY